MDLSFNAWRPDVGGPGSGYAQTAEGVVPQAVAGGLGYGPFPQPSVGAGAAALAADAVNILSVQKPDGTWSVYAATATAIYELQSDLSWVDVETGRTTVTAVSMVLFGKYLVNTDATNGMKAYDVSAGGANTAISGGPSAAYVFSMNNVLFALATSAAPRRFQSSDLGQYNVWTGGIADGKSFEDGGTLICGADLKNGYGVMWQERAIRSIQFGSGAGAYAISKIADGIGCVGAKTMTAFNGMAWWWDSDGPYQITAGGGPEPIGAEKINRWAADNIGRNNFANLSATVDPQRKLVLWRIDESRILAYSWLLQEFTILPASTSALARIATPAVSIDSLSGTIDALEGTIDSLGGGTAPVLGGLNNARKYFTFTGQNSAVTLETCAMANRNTSLITTGTPVDDADSGTLQIGYADRMDADLTWKPGVAKKPSGRVPLRARGKVLAFRRNIDAGADWSYANGVRDVEGAQGGPK